MSTVKCLVFDVMGDVFCYLVFGVWVIWCLERGLRYRVKGSWVTGRKVKRFHVRLVCKAHNFFYRSNLGLRVRKKSRRVTSAALEGP